MGASARTSFRPTRLGVRRLVLGVVVVYGFFCLVLAKAMLEDTQLDCSHARGDCVASISVVPGRLVTRVVSLAKPVRSVLQYSIPGRRVPQEPRPGDQVLGLLLVTQEGRPLIELSPGDHMVENKASLDAFLATPTAAPLSLDLHPRSPFWPVPLLVLMGLLFWLRWAWRRVTLRVEGPALCVEHEQLGRTRSFHHAVLEVRGFRLARRPTRYQNPIVSNWPIRLVLDLRNGSESPVTGWVDQYNLGWGAPAAPPAYLTRALREAEALLPRSPAAPG